MFLDRVSASVQEFVTSYKNDPFRDLNDPNTYEEVANVCSELKLGFSGVLIDYEHVHFAQPVKSVQSTLSHLISTSVPHAMFTHFFVKHGSFQCYSY